MYKINAIGAKIENYVDNSKDILKSLLGYTIENEGDDWRSRGGNPQLTFGIGEEGIGEEGIGEEGIGEEGIGEEGIGESPVLNNEVPDEESFDPVIFIDERQKGNIVNVNIPIFCFVFEIYCLRKMTCIKLTRHNI